MAQSFVRPALGPGLLAALLSAASFGLSGSLASGLMASGWSPGAAVTARISVAALALSGPALYSLRGRWGVLRANASLILLYGLAAVAGCQLAYFLAVERMPVAVALLIEYTSPVAVLLWLWITRGHRPSVLTAAGALVAAAGLVLVLDLLGGGVGVDGMGVMWALLAMMGAALFFIVSDESKAIPPLVLACGGLLVGALALAAAGLVGLVPMRASTAPAVYGGRELAWWMPVLALGLVTAALAYVAGIAAARLLGSRLASFVALGEVVLAVVYAWLLLGQMPRSVQLVGGALILAGVVLVKLGESSTSHADDFVEPELDVTTAHL